MIAGMAPGKIEQIVEEAFDKNGHIPHLAQYGASLTGVPLVLVCSPEGLKEILSADDEDFSKPYAEAIKPLEGNGLPASSGPIWKSERKLFNPLFYSSQLRSFIPMMVKETHSFLDSLDDRYYDQHVFSDVTLSIINEAIFSGELDFSVLSKQFAKIRKDFIVAIAFKLILGKFESLVPASFKLKNSVEQLDKIILDLKKERTKQPKEDILGLMIDADIDEKLLCDEARSFLFAGHETTANLLAWTCYFISKHPHVQQKILDEVISILGNDRDVQEEDIRKLKYCKCVLQETLRLRPPVPQIERLSNKDTTISGNFFPKGTQFVLFITGVHRSEEYWPNAHNYEPERFMNKIQPFTFIPFLAGPHMCIGNKFSLQEGVIILSNLIRRFQVEVPSDCEPVSAMESISSPKGLKVRFVKRNK